MNEKKVRYVYNWAEKTLRDYGTDWKLHNKLCDMLKSAIDEEPRQCDVGTASEQEERFVQFCRFGCGENCPLFSKNGSCIFHFEQMPYTENIKNDD